MVVLREKAQPAWYGERYINSLVKHGHALVLAGAPTFNSHLDIYFYAADESHTINQNIGFWVFPYVKEFMDGIISYKIENNREYISTEELEKFKIAFIKSILDQIVRQHQFTDERRRLECMYLLEYDKRVRERQLQKLLKQQ